METLGLLYRDPPGTDEAELAPFKRGGVVARADPRTGWLETGIVHEPVPPRSALVAFDDGQFRTVPLDELVGIESAPLPPLQLLAWVLPSAGAVFLGWPTTGDVNPVWIVDALLWDGVLVLGVAGAIYSRLPLRQVLVPGAIVLATIGALLLVPGSPGNAERHRSTQTVPLLLVLGSGLLSSLATRLGARMGGAVPNARMMPSNEIAANISMRRSAR
jgi:hypothetical protein